MIQTVPEMRAFVHEQGLSVWALGAVGALFESGLVDHLREPCAAEDLAARCPALTKGVIERCLAVAASVGIVVTDGGKHRLAEGALPFIGQPLRAALAGDIRNNLMQALALIDSCKRERAATGWQHTERALLQAQGDASGAFPPMFKSTIVPTLGDLAARLDRRGARFLDVGVGVASLSIAMCRAWEELEVVGLDTFDVPLGIARENVARAKLDGRIELRRLAVQDLRDEGVFDLAWLPGIFIAEAVLESAVARVRASLRQGGWILFPVMATGEARQQATWALINELWGGPVLSAADVERILDRAGFTSVRTIAGPPWAPQLVVGAR
jgi:precorrin-6B methylase 2